MDEFSRLSGSGNIYAVGDVALNTTESAWSRGHPQVAPAAIQQAKNLAKNLLKDPSQWTAFKYNDKGSMATIGRFKAVMDRGKLHLSDRSLGYWSLSRLAFIFRKLCAVTGVEIPTLEKYARLSFAVCA